MDQKYLDDANRRKDELMYGTQSSSKPRLKNDTLGDDVLRQLYSDFESMDEDEFQQRCIAVVQSGGGNQPRKDEIINAINNSKTRLQRLKKVQDFILAGMGLGV